MPVHDKVNGRSVHLDIHGYQPRINMEKCYCKPWLQRTEQVPDAGGIALAVNDSMHALHPGHVGNSISAMLENSSCAWHQLDMPTYTRKLFILYVSYALKLGVWLSFVSFIIHRSWKMSLISIIVMHIAEQCLYRYSPWSDSVEICCFRKKIHWYVFAFTF